MLTQQVLHLPPQKLFLCDSPLDVRKIPSFVNCENGYVHSYSRVNALTLDELPPNALRRKREPQWRGGFSLGLDLGLARTGLALSKGFSIRPLTVTNSLFLFYFSNFQFHRNLGEFNLYSFYCVLGSLSIFLSIFSKCWDWIWMKWVLCFSLYDRFI